MFIRYSAKNLHTIASYDGKSNATLRPGWNEFPSAIWEINKNDQQLQGWLADGILEISKVVVSLKDGKKNQKISLGSGDHEVHLTDIADAATCIKIVKETFDRELLRRWNDEETRHKVKRAVMDQLEPFENPKTASA